MRFAVILGFALLFMPMVSHASEQLESSTFQGVVGKIRSVGAKYGNENTLVVFDTDDTLLVLNQELGGEAWYEWQTGAAQCEQACTPAMKEPAGQNAIAPSIGELLNRLGEILYLSHAHPNEAEIPADIKDLQSIGIQTVVLTARGFLNRDATQRQYQENGISMSPVGLAPGQPGREYTPTVTDEEKQKFGITSVRAVNYTRGIINIEGQHKGVMLAAWLRELALHPKAIVFVDNESIQTNRVFSVFKDSNIDITTIRYSHSDPDRDAFWSSDKAGAIRQWKLFSEMTGSVFPK